MKINGIKSMDYQKTNNQLTLTLIDTSLDEILNMDVSMLQVTTDDEDLVECFVGYQITRIVYEASTKTYTAILDQQTNDTTAKTLSAILARLEALEAIQQEVHDSDN